MIRYIVFLSLLAISPFVLCAQNELSDSSKTFIPSKNIWDTEAVQISLAPALLFTSSAVMWNQREEVRKLRNRYIPTFKNHFDDYLQYAPALTVFGLNASGIKGKHSLQRASVSYLFSATIMALAIKGLKSSTHVERPDGSAYNSFPSGHTANSFMNATFLNKEYGQYRHPLYGVLAYTTATGTAVGRQLNNRHWISDVLAGAGIGILSTEIGYLITDRIYKNAGINEPLGKKYLAEHKRPSFIEIRFGTAQMTTNDLNNYYTSLIPKKGFNMGLNGAWFFHKNIGLGAQFAFSSFPVNNNLKNLDPDVPTISDDIYTQPAGIRYLHIGPAISIPLRRKWFITADLLAGKSIGADGNIILQLKEDYQDLFKTNELAYFKYKPKATTSWSAGLGIQKRIGRNLGLKAYANYFNSKHSFKLDYLSDIDPNGKYIYSNLKEVAVRFNHVVYGLGLTAYIW